MRLPYTENAKAALITAEKVAGAYGSGAIGTEHILYGLVATERCTASRILRKYGVDTSNFDGEYMTMSGGFMESHSFTSGAANALVNAERLAMKFGKKVVGTEQILYCLLLDPSSAAGCNSRQSRRKSGRYPRRSRGLRQWREEKRSRRRRGRRRQAAPHRAWRSWHRPYQKGARKQTGSHHRQKRRNRTYNSDSLP